MSDHNQTSAVTDRRMRRLRDDELVAALRRIGDEQADLRQAAGDLRALLELAQTPAILHMHTLTSVHFTRRDDVGTNARSIGLLNPSAITVYLGIGGIRAQPASGAIAVPAGFWACIPVEADYFQVGADQAALGAGDVTVYALRFAAVQPLFIGKAA